MAAVGEDDCQRPCLAYRRRRKAVGQHTASGTLAQVGNGGRVRAGPLLPQRQIRDPKRIACHGIDRRTALAGPPVGGADAPIAFHVELVGLLDRPAIGKPGIERREAAIALAGDFVSAGRVAGPARLPRPRHDAGSEMTRMSVGLQARQSSGHVQVTLSPVDDRLSKTAKGVP